MRKMSQTEELAKILATRARRHTLTPEQVSRAMDEQDYDVAGLDALYAELEARGIRVAEEEPDVPLLDEAQIGRLEHELSAEGVALDDPVKASAGYRCFPPKKSGHWPVPPRQGIWKPGRSSAKRTCGWWSRWPSAMRAGGCPSLTSSKRATSA